MNEDIRWQKLETINATVMVKQAANLVVDKGICGAVSELP